MRWILVYYRDEELGRQWRRFFGARPDITVLPGDICQVECDAIVSPANSFGFMDGGLDYYLSERFGWYLQAELQQQIAARPIRELLVGEALVLPTHDERVPWLISAPTMRVPMRLRQSVNAYLAMKAILAAARQHQETPVINTVAIPGLGTGCGGLDAETAALQMWEAFREIVVGDISYPGGFGEAQRTHVRLNRKEINLWDQAAIHSSGIAMLTREDIEQLLRFQSQAYELLLWLADEANRDPVVLSPEAASALRKPETAVGWLEQHRERIPHRLFPAEPGGFFASLLSSFFSTSFHVRHLEFEGRLVEARVNIGAAEEPTVGAGFEQCQALALRYLAASEKLPITEKDARRLVRRKSLQKSSLLWTYVWELDRRARQKGKGSVVHRLWRSIPREIRKSLSVDHVWQAREQLLAAVREYCHSTLAVYE